MNELGQTATGDISPSVAMLQMVRGFWVSRAIYVAANLGLADLLKDEPKRSEDLAQATATHAPSLYRLMRALASVGIFAQDEQGRFALTPVGATLRTDVPWLAARLGAAPIRGRILPGGRRRDAHPANRRDCFRSSLRYGSVGISSTAS